LKSTLWSFVGRVVRGGLAAFVLAGCNAQPGAPQAASPSPRSALAPAAAAELDAASEREPTTATLFAAAGARGGANWLLAGHGYDNNRAVTSTLTAASVAKLAPAWSTRLADDGEQEASLIVWNGTLFASTPHDHIVALNARTGKLEWDAPYTPATILDFAANRGVALGGGKIVIATQDCRVRALDARTGKAVWDVRGCSTQNNNWYSMPTYVYKNMVLVGTAGGDFGGNGSVQAFSLKDGSKLWQWDTIPGQGQPGHATWPGDSWRHGGAALWGGLSVDPQTDTLFIAPGNPSPDFSDATRKGQDLYADSVVALDIAGKQPRLRWYYRVVDGDTHDADPAMPPVLFEGMVGGKRRALLAIADKAGNFVILDRTTGRVVHRLAVANQLALDVAPTAAGVKTCPNHGGGAEWLGGAYDRTTNLFIIPVTQECGVFKSYAHQPAWVQGQNYRGGPPVAREKSSGLINAVDVSSGTFAWRTPVPYPAEGGALVTSTGLTFTSDLGGNLYALNTKTGKALWHRATGTAIVAPFSTYRIGADEYVAVEGGEAGNQTVPGLPASRGSYVMAFRVGAATALANSAAGQSVAAVSAGTGLKQSGTAPYTAAQVSAGKAQYAVSCIACHGAQLQGVSAPALAGAAFGKSHLSISALRTVVTQQMPLTAPGSLKPAQYASLMAYLLAANCVKPGDAKTPFPTSDRPEFRTLKLVGGACVP
jgi:alcohol dehydrogenase (cytochrome c)